MNTIVYMGISTVAGLIGWFTIFNTFVWPKLKSQPRVQGLKALTTMHFFRYFGTTFLITGLVTRKLPDSFAYPAAFGDLIALVLAYIAFSTLSKARSQTSGFLLPVWIFNILGTIDLLIAFVTGPLLVKNVGDFGLSYLVPTVYVPLLLVAHFYAFKFLGSKSEQATN